MYTRTILTNVIFVYYANNHLIGLFHEFCTLVRHYWKNINIHGELVTSQPHWFSSSLLEISKFSIFNNFLIYCPICMKFAPNSLVLEILWSCFTVSDPFPLKVRIQGWSGTDTYNQIPYPALKSKREISKYINWQQFTKGTRGKPTRKHLRAKWK